jgi:hypothetical protein
MVDNIEFERRKSRFLKLKIGIDELLKVTTKTLGINKSMTSVKIGFF